MYLGHQYIDNLPRMSEKLRMVVALSLSVLFLCEPWVSGATVLEEKPDEKIIPMTDDRMVVETSEDSVVIEDDIVLNVVMADGFEKQREFNPTPSRAVWLSALFPGLGQIYNRRFWKLPIIIGGFMGLGYGTSWNNNQYNEYSQAYRDLLDNDPSTNSYMNFFPSTINESDIDVNWLQSTMKSRKDYYRRNRDLCIICLVGLYLLCMVDAYVDASLAHFDISPDLSLDIQPTMFITPVDRKVAAGLNWAFNF